VQLLLDADSLLVLAESADGDWIDPVVARGWVAYLRAQAESDTKKERLLRDGLTHAERGLAMDHRHADALHLRGTLRYALYGLHATDDAEEWNELLFSARQDLDSAIALDPLLVDAYVTLTHVLYEPQIRDVTGALLAAENGFQRDRYLRDVERLMDRAYWSALDLESFGAAQRWCQRLGERAPESGRFARCRLWLMITPAVQQPDTAEARRLVTRLDSLFGDGPAADYYRLESEVVLAGIVGKLGDVERADSLLTSVENRATYEIDPTQQLKGRIAYSYSLFDIDRAIDYLKLYVVANPHHNFVQTAGTAWWWRGVVIHPRWSEVLAASQ
jgi:hypothetical protein